MIIMKEVKKVIYLQLEEDEADWLMRYTQNSQNANESLEESKYRCELFNKLKECLGHE